MATKDFNTATLTAKVFYADRATTSTGTGVLVYNVPADRCAKIQTLSIASTHTVAVTIDVYLVPAGATPGDEHKIVAEYSLGIKDTLSLNDYFAGMMLGEDDEIWVKASVINVTNVLLTGVEGV